MATTVCHNNPAYDVDLSMGQQFTVEARIFFIPSSFHFQIELNFPCPYCSMMTYFDYLNQAGYISFTAAAKMTVKRLKFSFWYPHELKFKHNQGQTWCICNISICCFFYNCYFIRILSAITTILNFIYINSLRFVETDIIT